MTFSLESIFGELGLSQYLNTFVDQGFDTWETILDITESDLDVLGVKLGHRRKLQRRIANSRGLGAQVSLVSPTRQSIEDGRHDINRPDLAPKSEGRDGSTSAKRKYRRHPKPDDNAPERPPSAYVLFSNKMREDLKGRQLTFTEIAKLVGENWQALSRAEREPYESHAQEEKERYNRELADYKKTPDYEKYCEYLNDFRKRQAIQTQEKDAAKRLKAESSESNRASATSGSRGSAENGSPESAHGSEPPPSRQQRFGSTISDHMPGINSFGKINYNDEPSTTTASLTSDNLARNRVRGLSSPISHEPLLYANARNGWVNGHRASIDANNNKLPWMQGSQPMQYASSDGKSLPSLSSTPNHGSRSSMSSGSASISRPPSLKTEISSNGSMSSVSHSLPRTPSDASLPIHALLSSKPDPSYLSQGIPPLHPSPRSTTLFATAAPCIPPDGQMQGVQQTYTNGCNVATYHKDAAGFPGLSSRLGDPKMQNSRDSGLDGISALLRARDIVDRRPS